MKKYQNKLKTFTGTQAAVTPYNIVVAKVHAMSRKYLHFLYLCMLKINTLETQCEEMHHMNYNKINELSLIYKNI